MSLKERCPNDLFSVSFLQNVWLEKQLDPAPELTTQVGENAPLARQDYEVVGSGDWGHDGSSGGSVVLRWGDEHVVKVPLGACVKETFSWAQEKKEMMGAFQAVSPPSMVIVARADNDEPKPVTIQEKINGRPVCETPLSDLFNIETLTGMKRILRKVEGVYLSEGAFDLCGQHFTHKTWLRIFAFLLFFSDNIMVDDTGRVILVDNTPSRKKRDLTHKAISRVCFVAAEILLDLLLILRKGWEFGVRLQEKSGNEKGSLSEV